MAKIPPRHPASGAPPEDGHERQPQRNSGGRSTGGDDRQPFGYFARVVAPVELDDPNKRKRWGLPPLGSDRPGPYIVELNAQHLGGLPGAENDFLALYKSEIEDPAEPNNKEEGNLRKRKPRFKRSPKRIGKSYYRCELKDAEWRRLVAADERRSITRRAIYRLWPDFPVEACTDQSAITIKSDAALRSFEAAGEDITWAVIDSGIDIRHPHFGDSGTEQGRQTHLLLSDAVRDLHRNFADVFEVKGATLVKVKPLESPDWRQGMAPDVRSALIERHRVLALNDEYGHGTHVAGIIAGRAPDPGQVSLCVLEHQYTINPDGQKVSSTFAKRSLRGKANLRGMAPLCKLISLRVLDHRGEGRSSQVIEALEYLREKINDNPKLMRVHGVNLSVGYPFDPEMFACGQSPLCTTVNRLVQEGVIVVTAAGNTGYGSAASSIGTAQAGLSNTINDPGNADFAITVGSTHRDAPHMYGVSYFSSKGPTADGRLKPDLVAPGERITSCAAGMKLAKANAAVDGAACYIDDTGTSMAAPHVSGAIAAFLSIRREFIGRPHEVKRIFLENATPLGRERYFEGHGLVDLMRAIQSV